MRGAKPPHWPAEQSWPADEPAPTITTQGLAYLNHDWIWVETWDGERRHPEISEVAALCGFPVDYQFPESLDYGRRCKGLGNAVPPPMARAWANGMAAQLRTLTT